MVLGFDIEFLCGAIEKETQQRWNILTAFAQRRDMYADDIESMIKIFAEASFLDQRFQVLMRRGDDAHVDLDRRMATDTVELAVGQHPQQTRLQFGRHVADLIEEQTAAVGLLETSDAPVLRAGEGAAFVAE